MKCVSRVVDAVPFDEQIKKLHIWGARKWSAHWITCAQVHQAPAIVAFRRQLTLTEAATFRIHVTADERYQLYIDGQCVGRGPERGDLMNWSFETYDLQLEPGPHLIVARVWNLDSRAPYAQMSAGQGFLLALEGPKELTELLETNKHWEAKPLAGYGWAKYPHDFMDPPTGTRQVIDGAAYAWKVELDCASEGWHPVEVGSAGERPYPVDLGSKRVLRPAQLPAMIRQPVRGMLVRHADDSPLNEQMNPVRSAAHNPTQAAAWQKMLDGHTPLAIPPHTQQRVIIDLQDYYCAYPYLTTTEGGGPANDRTKIRLLWAEALYESLDKKTGEDYPPKGNRNAIHDKFFRGHGDTFLLEGGASRRYETLWWRSGRYLELNVQTGAEQVIINGLNLEETHYPLTMESNFRTSGHAKKYEDLIPFCVRSLQNCSHETYMDCPFYEQLMYVGDTRLEALVTHVITRDARLPQKAVDLFYGSRLPDGLTQSRYPSRVLQVIPPFSLVWITMVHDLALWRGNLPFLKRIAPGVFSVLEAFQSYRNAQGLIEAPTGWNFVDWAATFVFGMPKDAQFGCSGILNLQYVYTLNCAVQFYELIAEPELAARLRQRLTEASAACRNAYWDEARGIFADDAAHTSFSEHAQCMAVLSGQLTASEKSRILKGLLHDTDLIRTTIYFSHYLFETLREFGRVDILLARFQLWFDSLALGFKTTPEAPEPTRSDCHAWGATPVYHFFASILGIRPTGLGFSTVEIRPQLGGIPKVTGKMVHPNGFISATLEESAGKLTGTLTLPPGLTGILIANGKRQELHPGTQTIS